MPNAMSAMNWLDRAVSVTCVGEVLTRPASRLQVARVSKRFRVADLSPGDTVREVKIEFHAPVPIDRIAYVRTRRNSTVEDIDGPVFAASDPVRHKLSTTDAHDGDVYDSGWVQSGIVNGVGYHDHIVPRDGNNAKRVAGFASFSFDAQSRAVAPENYVDWGRAWYGDMWEFDIGFAAPFDYGWRDRATSTRSLDGASEYVNDRTRGWRELNVVLKGVKMAERTPLLDFLEKTRTGARFYFVADAALADPLGCMIARNRTPTISQTDRAFNRFELSLIESL